MQIETEVENYFLKKKNEELSANLVFGERRFSFSNIKNSDERIRPGLSNSFVGAGHFTVICSAGGPHADHKRILGVRSAAPRRGPGVSPPGNFF